MDTHWLHDVVTAAGPVATAHVDVTRTEAGSAHEIDLRWAAVSDQLRASGAPSEIVDAVGERVLRPTGLAGQQQRSVLATADGILLDRVLPGRPRVDVGAYGLVPHLMPLVRAAAAAAPYLLVDVDHTGAEVTVVDAFGHDTTHAVEGGHDELHKVRGGGWAHRRLQSRVEDSWERNAAAVAADLDKAVAAHHPALVVLGGDATSIGLLRAHASPRVLALLVDEPAEERLAEYRMLRVREVVQRYADADRTAVDGLGGVVDALRQGAVDTLLLVDDPSSTDRLWAGEQPLQLGTTEADVRALGAQDVVEDRADAVLLRALVAQSGAVELVTGTKLRHGVGAILRFDIRPPTPGR